MSEHLEEAWRQRAAWAKGLRRDAGDLSLRVLITPEAFTALRQSDQYRDMALSSPPTTAYPPIFGMEVEVARGGDRPVRVVLDAPPKREVEAAIEPATEPLSALR